MARGGKSITQVKSIEAQKKKTQKKISKRSFMALKNDNSSQNTHKTT
jgi:hypothetical protein